MGVVNRLRKVIDPIVSNFRYCLNCPDDSELKVNPGGGQRGNDKGILYLAEFNSYDDICLKFMRSNIRRGTE